MFEPQIREWLMRAGLVYVTENQSCLRLRPTGWSLLRYLGFDYHRDAHYRSDYERRLEVANILLTFYRAGFDVFAEKAEDLAAPQIFLQSPAARRGSSAGDLWGGAVFHGLASIGEAAAVCYYVDGHGKTQLNRRNERMLLDKASAMLRRREAQIFAGPDYLKLARMLRDTEQERGKGTLARCTYAEMYRDAPCPLYLLECSDVGALQLMIMSQENYRKRLVYAMAGKETGPPAGIRDADGNVQRPGDQTNAPIALAVDMDVKRLDRAFKQSMDSGYSKIYLVGFEAQKKALEHLYAGDGRAEIIELSPRAITDAFGELKPYEPKLDAYLGRDGDAIEVTQLPIH
jgi:hypothetical protein